MRQERSTTYGIIHRLALDADPRGQARGIEQEGDLKLGRVGIVYSLGAGILWKG